MRFGEERERRTPALDIVSMSPPGYPSAGCIPAEPASVSLGNVISARLLTLPAAFVVA
jgi:hypothetical protein